MKDLSAAQKQALAKLTNDWQSAYELRESRTVLKALVRKNLAESKAELGSMFFPTNQIKYRLKPEQET